MALSTGTRIGLGLVVAGAITFLVLSDTGEGVLEYVYVDKVMEEPSRYAGRTIKVHGLVVEGSIKKKKNSSGDFTFVVEYAGHKLPVHYTNIPPDTFQEGGEVVLTGRLNEAGDLFESDEMSAKCPSKYEEQAKVDDPTKPKAKPET